MTDPASPAAKGISIRRPNHDAAPERRVPATLVATWPAGTVVENVVAPLLGCALEVDLAQHAYRVWLDHELLHKETPEPMMPGVNGVKASGGYVYFTSTERALVVRAADHAGRTGDVEVLAERFVGD